MTLIMLEMFGPSANRINNAFRCMEIAEEEILKAQARHPEQAAAINDKGFMLCCPPPLLQNLGDDLYRAHCKELLDRLATGGDVRQGTLAEAAIMLSRASLEAPLARAAFLAYARAYLALDIQGPAELTASLRWEVEFAEQTDPYFVDEANETINRLRNKVATLGRE